MLSKLFKALALLVLPAAAFGAGYRLTETAFERKLVPLPFEPFGAVVGLSFFFWTLSVLVLVFLKRTK